MQRPSYAMRAVGSAKQLHHRIAIAIVAERHVSARVARIPSFNVVRDR